jgi:hypothetical protein
MSPIVSRISVLLGGLLAEVPVGTKLALCWLLWALLAGRFWLRRGAVCPALADLGLPADAVRRSSAALTDGRWPVQARLGSWQHRGQQEGRGPAQVYEGFRPVVCNGVGGFRPQLGGWGGTHDQSGAKDALPAIVRAVVAAVGSVGNVRVPLRRLLWRADSGSGSEAQLPHRAVPHAGATGQPAAVLVVEAGCGGADLLSSAVPRVGARVARHVTAWRNRLPPSQGRGRCPI